MVHKNNKWNISKTKGEDIIHRILIDILRNSENNIILKEDLIILMNQKTKDIKFINNKQVKPISTYIRCIYGSLSTFLDTFMMYGIIENSSKSYVKLLDNNALNKYKKLEKQESIHDWELIVHEEFILI